MFVYKYVCVSVRLLLRTYYVKRTIHRYRDRLCAFVMWKRFPTFLNRTGTFFLSTRLHRASDSWPPYLVTRRYNVVFWCFQYYTRMTFVTRIFNRFHFSKTKRLQDIAANFWLADTGFKSKKQNKNASVVYGVNFGRVRVSALRCHRRGDNEVAAVGVPSVTSRGMGRVSPVMSRCAVMSVGCGWGRSQCSLWNRHNPVFSSYIVISLDLYICRAQWLRGRASDSRLREPGFESWAALLKPWARLFLPHCSSSLSYINEYLASDCGGYVYEQPSRINCSIWLDASQRRRDGVWVNRSVREVKCKAFWTILRTEYCAI